MATKMTLTPEAQAKVDAMLAAEPTLTAGLAPVLRPRATTSPLGRNADLARLVAKAAARDNGIAARAERAVAAFSNLVVLRLVTIRRYSLLGALIKRFYWGVSWHELAYRTKRKYYLVRPPYWEEAS